MRGADTELLRALATRFRHRAESTARGVDVLDPQIAEPDWWRGADADAFRASWNGRLAPGIIALADELDARADELERQAAQQDEASDARGVSRTPAGDAGGGPGNGDGRREHLTTLEGLGSPEERREFWDALSPEEQQGLIDADPQRIGNLDGVPLGVRADANQEFARRLLDERPEDFSEGDRETIEAVADGEVRAVVFDPDKGDIVQMLGEPGPGTTKTITYAPETGGAFRWFGDESRHPLPHYLADMHADDTVVFIYQNGDWAQKISPQFGDAERYSNDPEVALTAGEQLAAFQNDSVVSDPYLRSAEHDAMGFSFGHSVIGASEMNGAQYDHVVSVGGSNMPPGWEAGAGTEYGNFQYENDMLNLVQSPDIPGTIYGSSPDASGDYEQFEYDAYSDEPLIRVEVGEPRLGWPPIDIEIDVDPERWDPGEAHRNISLAGESNAEPRDDMEDFLYDDPPANAPASAGGSAHPGGGPSGDAPELPWEPIP